MTNTEHSGFIRFQLIKPIQAALDQLGWETPTQIQLQAIPLAKSGKDVLGIAQTGTGKTAAYLLPLMHKLHYHKEEGTRAAILVPTKELARQVFNHFEALNSALALTSVVLVGGIGMKDQLAAVKKGADLVIATPGRFIELYQTKEWSLKGIQTLIIDEADRMMDMGFMPQIRKILEVIPRKRQNLLFSATFPPKVENLSAEFLEFPERVEVTPQATPAETIRQLIYKTPNFQTKLNLLLFHLRKLDDGDAAIVFVKTKKHATDIGKFLDRKLQIPVSYLHANKGTNSRANSIDRLMTGELKVLVATDVAARGLDIGAISLVMNFDLPIQYEEYIHRIGRTGRALKSGTAISFVSPPDELHLSRIEQIIKMKIEEAEIPDGLAVLETGFEEMQDMLKRIDEQRKKANPDFKGAFHEKKAKNQAPGASTKSGKPKPPLSSAKPKSAAAKSSPAKGKKFTPGGKGVSARRSTKRRG